MRLVLSIFKDPLNEHVPAYQIANGVVKILNSNYAIPAYTTTEGLGMAILEHSNLDLENRILLLVKTLTLILEKAKVVNPFLVMCYDYGFWELHVELSYDFYA